MSMQDLCEGLDLVNQHSEQADFEGAKGPNLIVAAEQALGVVFPPTYRRFLQELGCGDIAGEEFFGVIGDDFVESSVPNGIWLTLMERKSGLPHSLVVVAATGDGAMFALNTSTRDAGGECPVVVWRAGQNSNENLERVAEDFGAFFRRRIEQAIGG